MTNSLAFQELRDQAIALRREGKSRREIRQILDIRSNQTLNEALRGEPPLLWTKRPNAKDERRSMARTLRTEGLSYKQIAAEVGVSKSSVSLWVRDLPAPVRLSLEERAKRRDEAVAAYWAMERPRRETAREAVRAAAQQRIGNLTDREVLIAGAIAYWCEGTKSKPYRPVERIIFMNSDPFLIMFFLRFLRVAGVTRDRLAFRLSIHESADVKAAEDFWLQITHAYPAQFRRANIKTHKPNTLRKNTGDEYRGCLRVDVLDGATLYRQIEGWCRAALGDVLFQPDPLREPEGTVAESPDPRQQDERLGNLHVGPGQVRLGIVEGPSCGW